MQRPEPTAAAGQPANQADAHRDAAPGVKPALLSRQALAIALALLALFGVIGLTALVALLGKVL